ncbi:ubiquinol-cytochrome c reductase complex assembly factor 6 [Polyergus mexicanus]|uniref:ubiquinol-cytochrome c reductase complex assembly factor 6 n=1 Tax=Polyergus mexicanus TaxID=615972 RepID=UPI0038B4D08F
MPAGVSWPRYIMFCTTAMITMLAGAQCVHEIYKPLDDLEDLVEQRLKERRKELQKK